MVGKILLGTAFALILSGPGFAGPCTDRLAAMEKSVLAKQEGGGPPVDTPATTGATTQGQGVNVTARSQRENQAMQMIQQAKQLDQQGKEAECMDMAAKIGAMAAPATK